MSVVDPWATWVEANKRAAKAEEMHRRRVKFEEDMRHLYAAGALVIFSFGLAVGFVIGVVL